MEQLTPLERELLKASGGIGAQIRALETQLQALASDYADWERVAQQSASASRSADASLKSSLAGYESRTKAVETDFQRLQNAFATLLDRLTVSTPSANEQHNSLLTALRAFDKRLNALESSQNASTTALER